MEQVQVAASEPSARAGHPACAGEGVRGCNNAASNLENLLDESGSKQLRSKVTDARETAN